MANLEPIEEKDLDLEHKLKSAEPQGFEAPEKSEEIGKEAMQEISPLRRIEASQAEKEDSYSKILSKVTRITPVEEDKNEIESDAEKTYQKTDAESQIQNLVDIAFTKGVIHAVKVAKHLEDNYVLDMFHDKLLADELHEALIQKGLIKEI